MVLNDRATMELMRAIAADDAPGTSLLLGNAPVLATRVLEAGASRQVSTDFYLSSIGHYLYAGDSPLHVAAAGYRVGIAEELLTAGANVSARNRRGAQPLHYAADGSPGSARWDPRAQAVVIELLLAAGADPNAPDRSGVAPLHRAVRCRCAAAVNALLTGGADPELRNRHGSTPIMLASRPTGRGGSGSPEAKAQQQQILRLLHDS